MRLLLCALSLVCLLAVISAKKQIDENIDPIEPETKEHSSKKYSKESQKPHHHGHKHKKHAVQEEQPKEAETKPKNTPVEIPEEEIKLQSDIETSKKAIKSQEQKAQNEDLHLQDLAHEESLKKDKKKKRGHHGSHHAEVLEEPKRKSDQKLFADQEVKKPAEGKVIEDTFEPLKEARTEGERKSKGKDKKSKDKSKGKKKASEKSKKSKDGKNKNKDKKSKNKDKKKW